GAQVRDIDFVVQRGAFFFSSRRRHTRWPRDWSSDVCSSDLFELEVVETEVAQHRDDELEHLGSLLLELLGGDEEVRVVLSEAARSEERRVGKECRCTRSTYHRKKKAMSSDR